MRHSHAPGSAEWTHRVACYSRRATSPICSNLSFRHTQETMRKASAVAAITASSISTPGAIMLELPDSSRWDSFAHIAQLPFVGREVRVQKGSEPRTLRHQLAQQFEPRVILVTRFRELPRRTIYSARFRL